MTDPALAGRYARAAGLCLVAAAVLGIGGAVTVGAGVSIAGWVLIILAIAIAASGCVLADRARRLALARRDELRQELRRTYPEA